MDLSVIHEVCEVLKSFFNHITERKASIYTFTIATLRVKSKNKCTVHIQLDLFFSFLSRISRSKKNK